MLPCAAHPVGVLLILSETHHSGWDERGCGAGCSLPLTRHSYATPRRGRTWADLISFYCVTELAAAVTITLSGALRCRQMLSTACCSDAPARGGIVVALREEYGIPVKLIGTGEGLQALESFDIDGFVDVVFG